jgi:hypothetical protein
VHGVSSRIFQNIKDDILRVGNLDGAILSSYRVLHERMECSAHSANPVPGTGGEYAHSSGKDFLSSYKAWPVRYRCSFLFHNLKGSLEVGERAFPGLIQELLAW